MWLDSDSAVRFVYFVLQAIRCAGNRRKSCPTTISKTFYCSLRRAGNFRHPAFRLASPRGTRRGRIAKEAVRVADATTLPGYVERSLPGLVAAVELAGIRSFLFVPMLKEDELIDIFTIFRQEVRPFSDKRIALVTTFSAQAVISIENARLLERATSAHRRTHRVAEATDGDLRGAQVISSSPGDLQPVFEAMLEKADRICDARFGNIFRCEDNNVLAPCCHAQYAARPSRSTAFTVPSRPENAYRSDAVDQNGNSRCRSCSGAGCESKAVSTEGKPLAGAAKTSFVKKCKRDACEGKAVSAEGKPLSGAA